MVVLSVALPCRTPRQTTTSIWTLIQLFLEQTIKYKGASVLRPAAAHLFAR